MARPGRDPRPDTGTTANAAPPAAAGTPKMGSPRAQRLGLTESVPELNAPTAVVAGSFLTAMKEFQAEGRGSPDDDTMIGTEIREWQECWSTPEGFADYVASLRAQSNQETPRPAGWVPCTTWWWVDGPDYLGRIALRHQLTDWLRETGGHIGYDVRPAAPPPGPAPPRLPAGRPPA